MFRYLVILLLFAHLVGCQTTRSSGIKPGFSAGDVQFEDFVQSSKKADVAGAVTRPAACKPKKEGAGVMSAPELDIPNPETITGVAFDPDSGALLLRTVKDVRVWDLVQGQQRSVRPDLADVAFNQGLSWPGGSINLYLNARKGTLDVFSASSGEPLASIWLTADAAWAVVDKQGRFDADPRHWRQFRWRDGSQSLDFVQLSDMYFEPSLLGKLAAGAKLDTPDAPPITAGIAMPPETQLEVRLNDNASQVFGTVKVKRRGACLGKVRVFHNDKAIVVRAPEQRNPAAVQETWRFSAPVAAGKQVFRALAASARKIEGEASRSELQVAGRIDQRPRAHVLVIGIDHYVNPALRLDFAVADGEGVVAWASGLEATMGAEFEKVTVTRIYDKEATRPRILRELEALQSVSPLDTVLIFMAGHGENDGVRWFFLPAEFGREISFEAIAAEGISSSVLQQALVKIPARRIALVVDACKSGELRSVFAAATDQRYLEWVSRTAGIQLLAATDQEQLAIELPELGHGALTYTLLQGLSGQADGPPGNGVVTAKELFRYAERSLPEVTLRIVGESQYPVVFEYGADFPLGNL